MIDIVGLIGVGLILTAYSLLQLQKLGSNSLEFSLMNTIGSALVLITLLYNFNLASFVIELFWLGISIYGVIKFFYR